MMSAFGHDRRSRFLLQEYDALLQTCRDGLKAPGVPRYDRPLRSSEQIPGGRTRVQNDGEPAASP